MLRNSFLRSVKRPYSEIDEGISGLVNTLNAIKGIQTIASCHGHIDCRPPYVSFTGALSVAQQIEIVLRNDSVSTKPLLDEVWSVNINFWYPDITQLIYTIHCPKYDNVRDKMLFKLYYFGMRRSYVNNQLSRLSQIIKSYVDLAA
ncbi:hypothetical protein [Hydromonas duriensis]|uniref:Uncharacterized protein n=1 Tax=Hydromonas duriensis TaxID=1527608 RepID=A0A4R6Y4X5_9BURK|nr:hypothetical protein [Hydromonas duriensis]TDR28947.1 hypothetical protein DFR44_13016 [Hydromonas duriensis]